MSSVLLNFLGINKKIIDKDDTIKKENIIFSTAKRLRNILKVDSPPYDPFEVANFLDYEINFYKTNTEKEHNIIEFDGCTLLFSKIIYLHDTNYYRKTFTLAHELFEDILNRKYTCFTEKDFNWGAAEFLMPADEFATIAKKYNFNLLELCRIYNNCSPLAISMRLLNLKLINTIIVQYNGNEKLYGWCCPVQINKFNIGENYNIILGW